MWNKAGDYHQVESLPNAWSQLFDGSDRIGLTTLIGANRTRHRASTVTLKVKQTRRNTLRGENLWKFKPVQPHSVLGKLKWRGYHICLKDRCTEEIFSKLFAIFRQERKLNAFPHFTLLVNGLSTHFIHQRSKDLASRRPQQTVKCFHPVTVKVVCGEFKWQDIGWIGYIRLLIAVPM